MIEKGKGPLGKKGEQIAAQFLEAHGHTILHHNWRSGHLEIDLISEDDFGLHFVEVKSRTAPIEVAPEENVNPRKQGKITSAALRYLNSVGGGDKEVFFDIIAVVFNGDKTTVKYFPQAWIPLYT